MKCRSGAGTLWSSRTRSLLVSKFQDRPHVGHGHLEDIGHLARLQPSVVVVQDRVHGQACVLQDWRPCQPTGNRFNKIAPRPVDRKLRHGLLHGFCAGAVPTPKLPLSYSCMGTHGSNRPVPGCGRRRADQRSAIRHGTVPAVDLLNVRRCRSSHALPANGTRFSAGRQACSGRCAACPHRPPAASPA